MFTAVVCTATMISATIGVGSLLLAGVVKEEAFSLLWGTWWLGDAVGGLVLTPFLLTWATSPDIDYTLLRKKLEILALTACTLICAALVFGTWFHVSGDHYPLSFSLFPSWFGLPSASAITPRRFSFSR